ncbi:MAG: hypothetical protein ACLFQB_06675, partial [Chitinispirillaceae bacterium]
MVWWFCKFCHSEESRGGHWPFRSWRKRAPAAGPSAPGDALRDSPITIVAVSYHELARHLVVDSGEDLQGKTLASAS